MKRLLIAAACATLVFAGAACSEESRDEAADEISESAQDAYEEGRGVAEEAADRAEDVINDRTVRIDDLKFIPAARTVKVGTEVTWINRDSTEHTVTANKNTFNSGNLATDKEFSFRFTQAGEVKYHCEIHGKDLMSGVITVE
jgi:plastocyanin